MVVVCSAFRLGNNLIDDLEIETTRPELIPACVALVAHPDDARFRNRFGGMSRTPLFDAEIASGQLVRLFDQSVASGWSYWLVTMDADFQSHDVKVFRQWLMDELGAAAPVSKPRPRRKIA